MGRYLTAKERYQIEAFLKAGLSKNEIANTLGKSVRTIRREISRGTVFLYDTLLFEYPKYCPDTAQMLYEENKKRKGRKKKIEQDENLVIFLENEILKKKNSPEVAIENIKNKSLTFKINVCFKTIYNYIDQGVLGILKNKHLTFKKNKKRKKEKCVKRRIKCDPVHSIENREKAINQREILNHWEMDCIESAKGKSTSLLVLTERVTRKTLIFKLKAKTASEVKRVLDSLEKKYKYNFKNLFKSITMDNGSEFKCIENIETSLFTKKKRTTAYYCHPYSSFERGSNENANRMIRRFIPKSSDISKYSNAFIKEVEDWLNNYPRKMFAFMSANEVYDALI